MCDYVEDRDIGALRFFFNANFLRAPALLLVFYVKDVASRLVSVAGAVKGLVAVSKQI